MASERRQSVRQSRFGCAQRDFKYGGDLGQREPFLKVQQQHRATCGREHVAIEKLVEQFVCWSRLRCGQRRESRVVTLVSTVPPFSTQVAECRSARNPIRPCPE